MADWIPVVSQLKTIVQAISGNEEGARRTQENFSKQCPGMSQVRSFVEAMAGDKEAARETQREFFRHFGGVADGIPVVGHVKGGIHYMCGDVDGGDNAMKAASRTTGALAGGAVGFMMGGPAGAVAGGVTGAATMDNITTVVDSAIHDEVRKSGYVQQISDIIENPNDGGKWFDTAFMLVGDGLTGYAGGKAAKHHKFKKQRPQFEVNKSKITINVAGHIEGDVNISVNNNYYAAEAASQTTGALAGTVDGLLALPAEAASQTTGALAGTILGFSVAAAAGALAAVLPEGKHTAKDLDKEAYFGMTDEEKEERKKEEEGI